MRQGAAAENRKQMKRAQNWIERTAFRYYYRQTKLLHMQAKCSKMAIVK